MLKRVYLSIAFALTCWMFFTTEVQAAQSFDVPGNSEFKSYMDYRTITSKNSKQYKIQQECSTDEHGLRIYEGKYTVAVGTAFGVGVGDYIDVTLESGTVLHCVVGDMKQNAHVGADRMQVTTNGNVVEFIVDKDLLDHNAKSRGTISVIPGFEGDVESITVLGATATPKESKPLRSEIEESKAKFEYLIVSKNALDLGNGQTLYSVDYAFGETFNNILCSEDFYNSVEVGQIINSLE